MNKTTVRLIQTELSALGLYDGEIDGKRGPKTHEAVARALKSRACDLPEQWPGWSDKRKSIAYLQLLCNDQKIDPGPIDGWWGPQTEFAFEQLHEKNWMGVLPPAWRDSKPVHSNLSIFPIESKSSLTDFYGPHGVPDGFRPSLCKVQCPWKLKLAWNRRKVRSFLWCHEKAAQSLSEVLERVHEHYGVNEIDKLGLNLFGGDYNARKKRGGSDWSTHAWGIAIDWDPDRNKLNWGRDRASLAGPEYEDWWKIWEENGWTSLGRACNYDWMHVQAARL